MAQNIKEMKTKQASATIEDYLSLLLVLDRDKQPATGSFFAKHLGVSAPTVTNTFKRMIRDGYVTMDEHKHVRLTEIGRKIGESVMRRHMFTEWLLTDTLDVPWAETHAESHLLEHSISKNVEKKLEEHIQKVKTCPHGNPLPGNEDFVKNWLPLAVFEEGEKGVLRRVHELGEDSEELLKYLGVHDFKPGAEFTVKQVLPFNQTMELETATGSITLGETVIDFLYAERI